MVDDVTLPGTGSKVATDDDGTRQYQWVKLVWGPDDTYNKVGITSGTPLPAQLRHSDGTIISDATGIKISTASQNANGSTTDSSSSPVAWSTEGKAQVGSLTETAPASDTASSGLNGRLQRVAQRITSLIALVPTSLGAKTAANSFATTTATDDNTLVLYGALTETAPASDTASSGLNGRLQRIAQNITTITIADDAAFTPGTTKVMVAGFHADETATDSVDEGDGGAARMTLDRKQIFTAQPHTTGGLSVFRSLDLDETEEDIKTSPGCLYKIRLTNRTTSVRYAKLYNDTAANVIVGTTAPLDTIPIPANASDYTVLTESFGGLGLTFSVALSIAATTGFADNDTGAPGANDVIVSAYYK